MICPFPLINPVHTHAQTHTIQLEELPVVRKVSGLRMKGKREVREERKEGWKEK